MTDENIKIENKEEKEEEKVDKVEKEEKEEKGENKEEKKVNALEDYDINIITILSHKVLSEYFTEFLISYKIESKMF
jgi:hypothetical protein